MISHLVLGVIARSSASGVSLKPVDSWQFTMTGVPSPNSTISGYETQYGAGMMTSSPGFRVASMALKMICLPPEVTTVCDGLYSRPWSRFILATIAWRSAGVPATAVYLVSLLRIAAIAASLMWSGVGMSGSPAARPITSLPAAFSSRNLPWAALVGEGLMRPRRSAMNAITLTPSSEVLCGREAKGGRLIPQGERGGIRDYL